MTDGEDTSEPEDAKVVEFIQYIGEMNKIKNENI